MYRDKNMSVTKSRSMVSHYCACLNLIRAEMYQDRPYHFKADIQNIKYVFLNMMNINLMQVPLYQLYNSSKYVSLASNLVKTISSTWASLFSNCCTEISSIGRISLNQARMCSLYLYETCGTLFLYFTHLRI